MSHQSNSEFWIPNCLTHGGLALVSAVVCLCTCMQQYRCQNDYMLLKSNSAIRRQLFAIERGRCTECSLDTEELLSRLRCLPGSFGGIERRLQMIFNAAPAWSRNQKRKDAARRLAKHPMPGAHPMNAHIEICLLYTSPSPRD